MYYDWDRNGKWDQISNIRSLLIVQYYYTYYDYNTTTTADRIYVLLDGRRQTFLHATTAGTL